MQIEINGRVEPFYLAELTITSFNDNGFLGFSVLLEGVEIKYEIIFKENSVQYIPLDKPGVNIITSTKKDTLSKWFQEEYPVKSLAMLVPGVSNH